MLGAWTASLLSRPDTTSFSFRGEFGLVCFTFTYFPSAESTGKINLKGLSKMASIKDYTLALLLPGILVLHP